jgi:hypothetical protein
MSFTNEEKKSFKALLEANKASADTLCFQTNYCGPKAREERYNAYKSSKNYESFLDAGGKFTDLLADLKLGYVEMCEKVFPMVSLAKEKYLKELESKQNKKLAEREEREERKALNAKDKALAVEVIKNTKKFLKELSKSDAMAYKFHKKTLKTVLRENKKVVKENEAKKRDAAKEAKKAEREVKKAEREVKKAEREVKKAEREAKKAECDAEKVVNDENKPPDAVKEEKSKPKKGRKPKNKV